jgi:hypothetical protein
LGLTDSIMARQDVSIQAKQGGKNGNVAPPAPRGNKYAVKHGLYSYKAVIEGGGIDRRSSLYKALREKEQELITSLGGDPSPQERVLIADSIKVMLYVGSLDQYLSNLKSLVRKGRPHPVLAIRTQLSAHLRENLKTLGLARRTKLPSLQSILDKDDDTPEANGKGAAGQ